MKCWIGGWMKFGLRNYSSCRPVSNPYWGYQKESMMCQFHTASSFFWTALLANQTDGSMPGRELNYDGFNPSQNMNSNLNFHWCGSLESTWLSNRRLLIVWSILRVCFRLESRRSSWILSIKIDSKFEFRTVHYFKVYVSLSYCTVLDHL